MSEIPKEIRMRKNKKGYTSARWFEEDVEAYIVFYVWPEYFTDLFKTDDLEAIKAESFEALRRYDYAS